MSSFKKYITRVHETCCKQVLFSLKRTSFRNGIDNPRDWSNYMYSILTCYLQFFYRHIQPNLAHDCLHPSGSMQLLTQVAFFQVVERKGWDQKSQPCWSLFFLHFVKPFWVGKLCKIRTRKINLCYSTLTIECISSYKLVNNKT